MKKSTKISFVAFVVVAIACGLIIWVENSQVVYDYRVIHKHDIDNGNAEGNLLYAFGTALRINHPEAYDMIDPGAKPLLDEWMNTHQSQKCTDMPHITLIESGTKTGSKVEIVCFGHNGRIEFVIDNIVIRDMKIVRWGEP